jgi:hypothetical protein
LVHTSGREGYANVTLTTSMRPTKNDAFWPIID